MPLLAALLAVLTLCVTGAAGAAPDRQEQQAPGIRLARVVADLSQPLLVTSPPGDARLFVVEQTGRIRIVRAGRLLARPFIDLSGRVSNGGEQGLLGLAFHPQYARSGRFFVNYTDRNGDTRVVEYRRSADPNRAALATARQLLFFRQPFPNHNGGHLAFGPDGFLYVSSGDGGSGGDPMGNGQRLDTLLGKILRIDVDRRAGGRAYAIPPGNPFSAPAARPEIFAYGLRNPWRFSFDRARGDLWIGDVGQNAIEEISFRRSGAPAGANFGWSTFEGRVRFPGGSAPNGPVVPPVAQYSHSLGCSVTGGFVYRGSRAPRLRGRYIYADYCSGNVWTMRAGPRPGDVRRARTSVTLGQVTSFGQDSRGDVYVVANASVYRIVG